MAASSVVAKPGEVEIVGTRTFDAPRAELWKMWTERAHVDRWWGPRGFTTTTHEMVVREGGAWRHTMRGPDGREHSNEIRYVEIAAPGRIVYDHVSSPRFRVEVRLDAVGERTRVTMRMKFESASARDGAIRERGAAEGLRETLGRLAGEVARERGVLLLERTFAAPRAAVFRAWSTAEAVSRWFAPRPFTVPKCELERRAGGKFDLAMRAPDGSEHWMRGAFDEVVDGERLVFHSKVDGEPREMRTVVTFEDAGEGRTSITVEQTIPSNEMMAKGQAIGWGMTLDQLGEVATQAG